MPIGKALVGVGWKDWESHGHIGIHPTVLPGIKILTRGSEGRNLHMIGDLEMHARTHPSKTIPKYEHDL